MHVEWEEHSLPVADWAHQIMFESTSVLEGILEDVRCSSLWLGTLSGLRHQFFSRSPDKAVSFLHLRTDADDYVTDPGTTARDS